jgi:tetratricopeptide (TPR) repeat protein
VAVSVVYFSYMLRRLFLVCASALILAVIFAATPEPKDKAAEAARLNNIGVAYMNQQLFEKALKSFTEAAELDPKLTIANSNRGIALQNIGKADEAKKVLEDAAKAHPEDPHIWYNLGLVYKNSSDSQATVEVFRKVTEIDPNDADTWYFLGTAYAQLKQFPQAIEALQHALKLNPLHASAEFGLSRAYQQSGDSTTAREHLKRFQYITQNKLGAAITLAYGEQGEYSKAEESPAVEEKVLPQIPVKFVDVTKEAGIVSRAGAETALVASYGPGACFLDYDNDGNIDLFVANNGAKGSMSLYHNLGNGKFEDVTKKAGLDGNGPGVSCTAGDYDNDGFGDLAVSLGGLVLLLHNNKNGTFGDVTEQSGIGADKSASSTGLEFGGLTFVDYDHDGDLDLYATQLTAREGQSSSRNGRMWRNNGNGAFTDVTEATGLGSLNSVMAAIGSDFNNDRAVDIVTSGGQSTGGIVGGAARYSPIIFENPREGKFHQLSLIETSPAFGIAALDFDHDGWMDYAFTHFGMPGVSLWRNNQGKTFAEVQLPKYDWHRAWGVVAFDYDNDGWVDLAFVGQKPIQQVENEEVRARRTFEIRLFRNLGPDGWKDVTADVGLDKIELKDPRAIITGDYDGDGATDLLITQNHGPAVLLRNEGGNKNNWLKLDLTGLADNKSAIGTKVEIFAGGNRQKFEIAGSNGYLGQNSLELNIGLGKAKQADVVRMLWPTGVVQDEIEVAAGKMQKYTEMDRRGSSCPTLFVWDGTHYELVADMIGAGVIGHWVAPGERNIARPTEYIKLNRDVIHEKDNKLSFRLMEPMEEVVYLDKVGLLAVDHPADFDVYPNEYFASNPPYPTFKVVASRNAQPPAAVHDEHGHDLLPNLLAHKYVGDFEMEPFKGFTKLHSLELDLGKPYRGGPLWLLLNGEIEYFTATGMYAADQAGIKAIAPYVEALGPNGKWTRVIDDMGFPAGGPRTMTADLSGKLPVGTQRIRIWTNLQIYWNSILVDRTPQTQPTRLTSILLRSADLDFHGYPRQIESQPPGVVKYVYEQVSRTGPYARQAGTYTRYGDVLPLLTSFDDRLAIFGSGEEVALEFDPLGLPSLPNGWVRDYFFVAKGYEKDMDFYAAHGDTVEPLPFRSMGTYPYPSGKSFPTSGAYLDYVLNYNTRQVSGNEPRSYRVDYNKRK